MRNRHTPNDAEMMLATMIIEQRMRMGLSRMQLAKKLKVTEAQIGKYETGSLVPLGKIEELGLIFGERVEKRVIRRISFLRKLERDIRVEQTELSEIYQELFPVEEDEEGGDI